MNIKYLNVLGAFAGIIGFVVGLRSTIKWIELEVIWRILVMGTLTVLNLIMIFMNIYLLKRTK